MRSVDVVVIGAGVLGCALARRLARTTTEVLVVERRHDLGEGSSKANSGIVHAGFQPRAGSLKGRSCVQGNAAFDGLCRELDVPFVRTGGLMVAFNDEGVETLREKAARAEGNGAGRLAIVDGDEARCLEPRLSPRVVAALMAPTTGVVSPFELVFAMAQNAAANGVSFEFEREVRSVEPVRDPSNARWLVRFSDGDAVAARFVANMAGDGAVFLDSQVRPADYVVRPRLGEYVVFDRQEPETAIRHVIYQAAETDEGGTLLAPTVEGNLLAGPTSVNVRRFDEVAVRQAGIDHVLAVARKLIPDLDVDAVITSFAGARTNIVNVPKELKDFVVRVSAPGFVSALGIKNPGLTSSPMLAQRAFELLVAQGMDAGENPTFDPMRERYVPWLQRDGAEQELLLAKDPSYGRVICRCEGITEGDVHTVMDLPLGPSTLAGVKRRLRCGMGRCQGGFCSPRVVDAMAAHLGIDASAVPFGEGGGRFVARRVK